jgi:hypothetical protein
MDARVQIAATLTRSRDREAMSCRSSRLLLRMPTALSYQLPLSYRKYAGNGLSPEEIQHFRPPIWFRRSPAEGA